MAWLVLLGSGLLETAWAAALSASRGLTRPVPVAVFAVTLVLSMAGLAVALRSIPVGTAYAVWAGTGVVGTVLYGAVFAGETMTLLRGLFLGLIVVGIIGVKAVG
jgi:quaternary ammonium compound-resistance protein SugE